MSDAIDMHELLEVLKDKASLDLLDETHKLRSENEELKVLKGENAELRRQLDALRRVADENNQLQTLLVSLRPQIEEIQTRQQQNEVDIQGLKEEQAKINLRLERIEEKHMKFINLEHNVNEIKDKVDKRDREFRRKNQDIRREKERADKAEKNKGNLQKKLDKTSKSLRNKNAKSVVWRRRFASTKPRGRCSDMQFRHKWMEYLRGDMIICMLPCYLGLFLFGDRSVLVDGIALEVISHNSLTLEQLRVK